MPEKCFIPQRLQPVNSAMDSAMFNDDNELRHHFFEVAQAEGIYQTPAVTLH